MEIESMSNDAWVLSPDRFFDPEPSQLSVARRLYATVGKLPIVSPHGHVDPRLFADANATFGSPADLLIVPDHYVFRMLYSQGVPLESLGVPRTDGGPVERDGRKIWQAFADHFHLYRGTPSGVWLAHELTTVFGVTQRLNSKTAQEIYDQLEACLASPAFRPRALFERFNIEVLCTTDGASDPLASHQAIRASGWKGNIRPTFRPDQVTNLLTPGWSGHLRALGEAAGMAIHTVQQFVAAIENRRAFFKSMGATATDHGVVSAHTGRLSDGEAEAIFARALRGEATEGDATRFTGHMLVEMARMSLDDGLVMQIHVGVHRNHNAEVFRTFGADKGADIPIPCEFVAGLKPLLDLYGRETGLGILLFTMDETTYSRELAPLAGHYPALKVGPPWWFQDSLNGMRRYFDQVMETAGLYNTAGFNDDTRAFPSIPARHDVWRRAACNWLAGLVVRGLIAEDEGFEMASDMACGLARRAYRLDGRG
jgi:glucuronate isomerase